MNQSAKLIQKLEIRPPIFCVCAQAVCVQYVCVTWNQSLKSSWAVCQSVCQTFSHPPAQSCRAISTCRFASSSLPHTIISISHIDLNVVPSHSHLIVSLEFITPSTHNQKWPPKLSNSSRRSNTLSPRFVFTSTLLMAPGIAPCGVQSRRVFPQKSLAGNRVNKHADRYRSLYPFFLSDVSGTLFMNTVLRNHPHCNTPHASMRNSAPVSP